MNVTLILTAVAGLLVLLFGRQLFWLFVAIVGFAFTFELVPRFLPDQPELFVLLLAVLAGLVGAVLAIFLQYVAAGIAGFLGGAYLALILLPYLGELGPTVEWVAAIVGGVVGAILVLLLYDWALIILSAAIGASMLVQLLEVDASLRVVLWAGLALVGIIAQAIMLRRSGRPVVRRRLRRVS
jgi:hypothetical protein